MLSHTLCTVCFGVCDVSRCAVRPVELYVHQRTVCSCAQHRAGNTAVPYQQVASDVYVELVGTIVCSAFSALSSLIPSLKYTWYAESTLCCTVSSIKATCNASCYKDCGATQINPLTAFGFLDILQVPKVSMRPCK